MPIVVEEMKPDKIPRDKSKYSMTIDGNVRNPNDISDKVYEHFCGVANMKMVNNAKQSKSTRPTHKSVFILT